MDVTRLKELLHYNPNTGIFTRKKCTALRHKLGEVVGVKTKNGSYLKCGIDSKEYLLHRLAVLYMTGKMPAGQVDHINHNGLDNCWSNLRVVSPKLNQQNMSKSKRNTTGITGVSFDNQRNKWIAQIYVNGKTKLKRFNTKFGAIRQRILWNREYSYHKNHGKSL
jgi:hypothetical protein